MAGLPNNRFWRIFALFAVLAGFGWRAAHLENRPLHADEAVQAWQTWNLLRGEGYTYDPVDRHGPFLYYGAAALHRVTGGTAATFNDHAARRFPLLAGVATLALLAFGARRVGLDPRLGALAAALLAFETLSTLYHTYFVQEAWLVFFVWAFLFTLLSTRHRLPSTPSVPTAVALGALFALAQTNKEIAPIYAALAWISVTLAYRQRPKCPPVRLGIAIAIGYAVPLVLFYSSFGTHPAGVLDAFRTYFLQTQRLAASPHTYPWWHYLETLGLIPTGGPRWGQFTFLALALIGIALAARPRDVPPALRAIAIFTVALLGIHSAIGYKTPWLLLTPMIGLGLLAAHAVQSIGQRGHLGLAAAIALGSLASAESAYRGWLALDRYPGDARNPYFYQQTPRGFARLPARLNQLQTALGRDLRIAVISPEHAWPLPWYLRKNASVGYFDQTAPAGDWDVLIWDDQLGPPPLLTNDPRIVDYYGLRPNVLLPVLIEPTVWNAAFPPDLPAAEVQP